MIKKNDIYVIILLVIVIVIFAILNKKNEKILRENFYSNQPGPSPEPTYEENQPGPSPEPTYEENQPGPSPEPTDEENQPGPSPEPTDEETGKNLLLEKLKNITIDESNETQKIFKEKLMNELFISALSNKLKSVLGDKLKDKNLNNILNFEIKENIFSIKISNVNGLEIINNQQLLNNIKKKMLELFAIYIPDISKYELLVTSGSLIITLKKKDTTTTCEATELQELEAFMKMFNNSGENIIQYEPDGVSGIFAPYIKLG